MTWLCSMRPIHLGDEATRAFTRTVAYTHITSLLAHKTLRAHTPVKLQEGVLHCATGVWQQLEERLPTTGLNKAPLHQPVQEALRLAEYLTDLAAALRQQPPLYQTDDTRICLLQELYSCIL